MWENVWSSVFNIFFWETQQALNLFLSNETLTVLQAELSENICTKNYDFFLPKNKYTNIFELIVSSYSISERSGKNVPKKFPLVGVWSPFKSLTLFNFFWPIKFHCLFSKIQRIIYDLTKEMLFVCIRNAWTSIIYWSELRYIMNFPDD